MPELRTKFLNSEIVQKFHLPFPLTQQEGEKFTKEVLEEHIKRITDYVFALGLQELHRIGMASSQSKGDNE